VNLSSSPRSWQTRRRHRQAFRTREIEVGEANGLRSGGLIIGETSHFTGSSGSATLTRFTVDMYEYMLPLDALAPQQVAPLR